MKKTTATIAMKKLRQKKQKKKQKEQEPLVHRGRAVLRLDRPKEETEARVGRHTGAVRGCFSEQVPMASATPSYL